MLYAISAWTVASVRPVSGGARSTPALRRRESPGECALRCAGRCSSHMATEGVDPLVPEASITYATTPTATTPLLATSMIPVHQRYPITPWAPRTGRTSAYHQWRRDVGRLLASFSLSWEDMQQDAPIAITTSIKSESGATTRARATDDALRTEAWQRVNTALYWHVEPSLRLVGPVRAMSGSWTPTSTSTWRMVGRSFVGHVPLPTRTHWSNRLSLRRTSAPLD